MLRRYLAISAVTLLLILLASYAYAIPPRHNASAITEGTFNSGNYTFPDSLNTTSFLEAASIFFVNPITQKVGIGIANPDTTLHVNGDVKIEGALNTTGDVFLPTQSLSSCSGKLITDTDGNITCAADESYNSTYDLYAYNQTTPAIDYVNQQGYLTNESDPLFTAENVSLWQEAQNKYNATYDLWAYNQTTPAIDYVNAQGFLGSGDNSSLWLEALNKYNSTYDLYAYNMTTPAIAYSDAQGYLTSSGANLTYLFVGENLTVDDWTNVAFLNDSVFNSTYGTVWTNVLFVNETTLNDSYALNSSLSVYDTYAYNQTTPAIAYADSISGSNTYNATYDLYAYNQTAPAISFTTSQGYLTSAVPDYVNIAMTNQTNTFTPNQTFSDSAFVTNSLGVGTTGPGVKLDIQGDDATHTVGVSPYLLLYRPTISGQWAQAASFALGKYDSLDDTPPHSRLDINLKESYSSNRAADVTVMTLQSDGNVGIGTATPGALLHVFTETDTTNENTPFMVGSRAEDKMVLGIGVNNAGDYTYIQSSDWNQHYAYLNLNPNGGNVGIGTTNPAYLLDVKPANNGDAFRVGYNGFVGDAEIYSGSSGSSLLMRDGGTTVDVQLSTYGDSYFNGGNVGIGTTSPSSKFEVSTAGGTADIPIVLINNTNVGTVDNLVISEFKYGGVSSPTTGAEFLRFSDSVSTLGSIASLSGNGIQIESGGNISLLPTGNVGIGTTEPGAKLVIKGDDTLGTHSALDVTDSNDVSSLYVRNDGRIGMGTLNPPSRLAILDTVSGATSGFSIGYDTANYYSMYRSSANGGYLTFEGIGTAPGFVFNTGNVGIGVTNPDSTLTLKGADTAYGGLILRNAAGSDIGSIYGDGGNFYVEAFRYTTDNLSLGTVGNTQTVTLSAGNVGIGTTGPEDKLTVYAGVEWSTNLRVLNLNTGSAVEQDVALGLSTSRDPNFVDLTFSTEYGSGVWSERMRLTNTGNVGIGTVSPNAKLHVESGDVQFNGTGDVTGFYFNQTLGNVGIGTATPNDILHIQKDQNDNTDLRIQNANTGVSAQTRIVFKPSGDNADALFWFDMETAPHWAVGVDADDSNKFKFASNAVGNVGNNALLTIQSTGNVGIGTTGPQALLDVQNGAANTTTLQLGDDSANCTHNPEPSLEIVACSSDIRMGKMNIRDADKSSILNEFSKIKVRDYELNTTGATYTGVVAQELQETNPDQVIVGDDGTLMVMQPSPWKLLAGIQELKSENDLLKSELCRKDDFYSWCKKGLESVQPAEQLVIQQPVNETPSEQTPAGETPVEGINVTDTQQREIDNLKVEVALLKEEITNMKQANESQPQEPTEGTPSVPPEMLNETNGTNESPPAVELESNAS
jgi:hypothetical protein